MSYLSGGRSTQLAIRVISSSRGASLLIRNIIASGSPMLGAAVTISVPASLFAQALLMARSPVSQETAVENTTSMVIGLPTL